LLIQILGEAVWAAFTGFFPLYLIEVKSLSPTLASGLFALFFAGGVVIKPVTGNIYDRVGARRSIIIVMTVSGIGLVALAVVDDPLLVALSTVLASTMLGRGAVVLPYMTNAIPEDERNSGLGMLRTIYITGSAASPVLFGAIADHGFFTEAIILLAGVTALAVVLVFLLPKSDAAK